jgi:sulfate transport system permease protein
MGNARARWLAPSALPGFPACLGITAVWLGAIVVVPLAALVIRPWQFGIGPVLHALWQPRVAAALELSFGAAVAAAAAAVPLGLLIAWVLVRLPFPGRRIVDGLVDLPFALPTAVAGIALTALYAPNGWLGGPLAGLGVKVAYTRLGIVIALVFVGLPYMVRTLQPVLRELPPEVEEAATTLGATGGQIIRLVTLPALLPAILTGAGLAFARAVGEYGSVIFIAGNLPRRTEIAPLLIVIKLEQFDYVGATAIALAMLVISFTMLGAVNLLQRRIHGRSRR